MIVRSLKGERMILKVIVKISGDVELWEGNSLVSTIPAKFVEHTYIGSMGMEVELKPRLAWEIEG